jgi:hypothetical protein
MLKLCKLIVLFPHVVRHGFGSQRLQFVHIKEVGVFPDDNAASGDFCLSELSEVFGLVWDGGSTMDEVELGVVLWRRDFW